MKSNRHCHILLISIIMVVSIILSSCGIPTFCTLNNLSINKKSNPDIGFTISGTDEDLTLVEQGPGVILLYVLTDNSNLMSDMTTSSSGIVKEFNTLATNKLYINSDNSILTYLSGDNNKYTLFAFNNYINSTTDKIKTPSYNINLKNEGYIEGNSVKNASFNITINSWNKDDDEKIIIDVKDSDSNIVKQIIAEIDDETKTNLYVYVAFSAEVGQFSNNYWSKLTYIGKITKE